MTSWNLPGFILLSLLTLALGGIFANSRRNPFPARLLLAALALRIVGATVRFDMIRLFYGGLADAQRYFRYGLDMAEMVWSFDPYVFSFGFWFGSVRWWGTSFMEKTAGVVVSMVGPSMRASYLVYSLLSFAGLYLIALAVHRHRPGPGAVRFATWIWLWPSLWFWPSSIGKESLTVLAIGLAFYGYAGRDQRTRWLPFAAGVALAFAIRPHVGAVLGLATMTAFWLRSWKKTGPRRIVEGVLAAVVALFMLSSMAAQFGLDSADLEGVQEFVTYRTTQTLEGGSSIGGTPNGLAALPMAYVNIWLRPFPWDVHNVMALFSALEVMLLWALALQRRQVVWFTLKHWRRDRLLAWGLPFLAGYTLMIGLTFANLGIIARQRSPLFPFVFLLLTGAGAFASARLPQRQAATNRPAAQRPAVAAAVAQRR